MPSPETRELRQCTYTPIRNHPSLEHNLPDFRPQQPFLGALILETVFGDASRADVVLKGLRESVSSEEVEALADGVGLLWDKGTAAAAKRLANLGREKVFDLSRRAIVLQRKWARTVIDAYRDSTLEALEETVSIKKDQMSLEDLREEVIRGHERLSAEVRSLASSGVQESSILAGTASEVEAATEHFVGVFPSGPRASRVLSRIASVSTKPIDWLRAAGVLTISGAGSKESVSLPYSMEDADTTGWIDAFSPRPWLVGTVMLWINTVRTEKALAALAELSLIEPVGFLHLERLIFTPIDYERGELVYSLPLVPGERVRFTHREWTRTETDYEDVAMTSLETAIEDTLSEKSELTESVNSENQRSSALDASVDAEGGFGPVSISTHVGYNVEESETVSREKTAKRSQEVTRKASTRAKKEHKITFRVTRDTGVEDESYREIVNATDEPVRWDFHRVMKKWEIELYRYGLRMTYDIVLPEPGSYLLRQHLRLQTIEQELAAERILPVAISSLTRESWRDLASEYGARLDPPPVEHVRTMATAQQGGKNVVAVHHLDISLPEGYEFESWDANGTRILEDRRRAAYIDTLEDQNNAALQWGLRHSNRFSWKYLYDSSERGEVSARDSVAITVIATGVLTSHALEKWQAESYDRLIDAFKSQRSTLVDRLEAERLTLRAELMNIDALKLRKLEKEEIMKGVLRMMLGPHFRFYSERLPELTIEDSGDLALYDPETGVLRPGVGTELLMHGKIIRFLHHAIEWENINYVLYPYFWTDTDRWDFKQSLDHPDYVHRNFLRSGAARVVLTIRPGFEKSFLSFVETADTEELLPEDHPYLRLGEEVRAMAEERYPYTPGGVVLDEDNRVDRWIEYTPTGALDVVRGEPL